MDFLNFSDGGTQGSLCGGLRSLCIQLPSSKYLASTRGLHHDSKRGKNVIHLEMVHLQIVYRKKEGS